MHLITGVTPALLACQSISQLKSKTIKQRTVDNGGDDDDDNDDYSDDDDDDDRDDDKDDDDDDDDEKDDDEYDTRKITSHQEPLNLWRESLKARLGPFAQLALQHD